MNTITLNKEAIHAGDLLLVNREHPIQNAALSELVPADAGFPDILLQRRAAESLQLLLSQIGAGSNIVPVSGYRPLAEQEAIYQDSLMVNGTAFTKQFVALPNHSEHQTGLAIDLARKQENIDFICPDFPQDGICGKFRIAAADFGFIERYGKDKEAITGISHEPWHFRYVGIPHARVIQDLGLSLEEYIEYIKAYREDAKFLYKDALGRTAQIYYVPAVGARTKIPLPEYGSAQLSGNNVDGFIVTVWRQCDEAKS